MRNSAFCVRPCVPYSHHRLRHRCEWMIRFEVLRQDAPTQLAKGLVHENLEDDGWIQIYLALSHTHTGSQHHLSHSLVTTRFTNRHSPFTFLSSSSYRPTPKILGTSSIMMIIR